MDAIRTSEDINHHRRRFLGTAAMTVAAAQFGMIGSAARTTRPGKVGSDCPRSSRGRTRRSVR